MARNRLRGRKIRKQRRIVIAGIVGSMLFLTVGYAAFSTNITLTAKGNVHPAPTTTVADLKNNLGTCSNGQLVADPDETGRYVFKGADPCNYLTLNNETWRIMSIESDDTIKIIREDSIGSIPFDPGRTTEISGITTNGSDVGTRWYNTTSSDFCYFSSNNYGCKVWGSKDTMRNSSGVLLKDASGDGSAKIQRVLTSATTYDLPNDEAYLNIYLNGGTYAGVSVPGWYNTWSSTLTDEVKSYIVHNHLWNVGLVSDTSGQLTATDITQEKALTWQGRVGLMTASEYVRASSNTKCTGVYAYRNTTACYNNSASYNYLRKTNNQWTVSPYSTPNPLYVWAAYSAAMNSNYANYPHGVRPVLYLSSDVVLKGAGTASSKYEIK